MRDGRVHALTVRLEQRDHLRGGRLGHADDPHRFDERRRLLARAHQLELVALGDQGDLLRDHRRREQDP